MGIDHPSDVWTQLEYTRAAVSLEALDYTGAVLTITLVVAHGTEKHTPDSNSKQRVPKTGLQSYVPVRN